MRTFLPILCLATLLLSAAEPITSTQLLKTRTTWNGAPIHYSASANPEVQALRVEVPAGASIPWHQHPVNNYAYILEGDLRVELEDKTFHEFHAGESFAEVVGTWHRGVNIGKGPVKLLVFYLGELGVPLTSPR